MSVEETLAELGFAVPEVPKPVASYVPAVRSGTLVFTSGQLPVREGQLVCTGSVGAEVTEEEARNAARLAALNALAAIKTVVEDLDAVVRVVRLTGYVSSAPGFVNQPAVINGASDLLLQAFGERGRHSRAAVGVFQLPLGAPVEVDMIVEVADRSPEVR